MFRLKGVLHVTALEAAFGEIVNRHEVLRTIIKEDDGQGYQQIMPQDNWKMQYVDAGSIITDGITIEDYIRRWMTMPFDLAKDNMLRYA